MIIGLRLVFVCVCVCVWWDWNIAHYKTALFWYRRGFWLYSNVKKKDWSKVWMYSLYKIIFRMALIAISNSNNININSNGLITNSCHTIILYNCMSVVAIHPVYLVCMYCFICISLLFGRSDPDGKRLQWPRKIAVREICSWNLNYNNNHTATQSLHELAGWLSLGSVVCVCYVVC